jgi:peptidoglycan/LPS O-acetylase OafA/YrhL
MKEPIGTLADAMATGRDNFGLLRLALAFAVVISHAFSVKTGLVDDEPLKWLTGFTLGEHAVNGFFAISGFLVTMSFERRGWRDYVLARSLRIMPGLIAAVLATALIMGPLLTSLPLKAYLADPALWRFVTTTPVTFKSTLPLPGVFEANPFRFPMGTVWTLKYELLCYGGVLLAGLAGLMRFKGLVLGLVILLAVAAFAREIIAPGGSKGLETALRLPLIFLAGGAAYLWRERLNLSRLLMISLLSFVVLLSATPFYKPLLYLWTAYAMLVLALRPALTGRLPAPETDLSYGVYLYGWPLQQALVALLPNVSAAELMLPSLILTALVAALSWFCVEKPALALKRRLIRPSPGEPS